MNWQMLLGSKIVEDLGWTLVHSIWQIGLVAAVLFIALKLVRPLGADLRYGLSIFALMVSLVLPVATFFHLSGDLLPGELLMRTRPLRPSENGIGSAEPGANRPATFQAGATVDDPADAASVQLVARLREFLTRSISIFAPYAVAVWLLGIAFFSLRLGGGFWQLRQYKTRAVSSVDPLWQSAFTALCKRLDVGRRVRFLQSSLVETPIAIGFFRPLVIVPASLFLQVSPHELQTIIAHELIHIRRLDPLVNLAQGAIEVIFFYHPAVWWISRQVRVEREFVADAAVMDAFRDSHVMYARALANLEEIRLLANQDMPRIATAANGGNLMQRIQRILKIKTEVSRASSAWSAGLALLLTSALLTVVFSFSSSGFVNAQGKAAGRKLAIGFVAIPPVDRSENPPKDSDATARLMIAKLQQYKIPAIGFVNGSSVSDGAKLYPVRANIVRLWRDAGLEVGVGGYNHIWFSKTDYTDYVANVAKNVTVVSPILAEKRLAVRYYSYPYLNTGRSDAEHQLFEKWLGDQGLRSVKYTVDNSEWMYSYAYDMARNDNDINTMKEIRVAFVDYMTQMFALYETYSTKMFGRDIPQTMVLTPSRLVTDSADDLFGMIQKRGYTFVSMDEAQSDPAYETEEHFVGDAGISWFERWAMSKGMPLLDEPKVNDAIQRTWLDKKIMEANKKKDS